MNNLIDTWFTVDQLVLIRTAVKNYYDFSDDKKREELHPVLEHLDHLIKHYE